MRTPDVANDVADFDIQKDIDDFNSNEKLDVAVDAEKLPDLTEVVDKPCTYLGIDGTYTGKWMSGTDKNYDNPGCGIGLFISSDGRFKLAGTFGTHGYFTDGAMYKDGKEYHVEKGYYYDSEKGMRFAGVKGTGYFESQAYADGFWQNFSNDMLLGDWAEEAQPIGTPQTYDYKFETDENFNISSIEYKGITMNLQYPDGIPYLVNKSGDGLALNTNSRYDIDVCRIAKIIYIVQNSGEKLEEFILSKDVIQADYYGTPFDTDMLRKASTMLNVSPEKVVNWLNASMKDYGI